jgi:hypothetical protein
MNKYSIISAFDKNGGYVTVISFIYLFIYCVRVYVCDREWKSGPGTQGKRSSTES